MDKEGNKKYKVLENVLNYINSKVIALQDGEVKTNNIILTSVTDLLIQKMKQKDTLFNALYQEKFYGGSYYDQLKVGNPNEFDLDLILTLPGLVKPCVNVSDAPGFVEVEVKEYDKILSRPQEERNRFEKMDTLLNGNYLSTKKVLNWMEGVITKSLKDIDQVDVALNRAKPTDTTKLCLRMTKEFPAFTLRIAGRNADNDDIQLDIDLVACFSFTNTWPEESGGYRQNPSADKNRFLVVPKQPREETLSKSIDRYWRLSFQEQERQLISGKEMSRLKPSLKLIKKLRDKNNHHKIASYFIKTVYLWAVEKEPMEFWSQPLGVVFITMLKKYEELLKHQCIPYYWNQNYNLIGYLKLSTKTDIANAVSRIVAAVDKSVEDPVMLDPYVVGKFLLTEDQLENLKAEVNLGKKHLKIQPLPPTISPEAPPLQQLGFEPELVTLHRQYSDNFEAKQQEFFDSILSQVRQQNSSTKDVMNYLKQIDDKLTEVYEKVTFLQTKIDRVEQDYGDLRRRLVNKYNE